MYEKRTRDGRKKDERRMFEKRMYRKGMKCKKMELKDEDEDEDEEEEMPKRKAKKCSRDVKCKKMELEDEDEDEEEEMPKRKAKKCMRSFKDERCCYDMFKKETTRLRPMELEKKEEKVVFSHKDLILTQDIFDGCWNLNPQTKLLIEKNEKIYEKIENLAKEKNLDKEEIKVTLLVLYYLNTDSSINKIEVSLIIKKGISFLEKNGINFEEILSSLK